MKILILLILVSCSSQMPKKRTDRLSILQGITNLKEVEFSVVAPRGIALTTELRSQDGEIISPVETKVVEKSSSDYAVYKSVFVRDQKKDFNLYVYDQGKLVDQRLVGKGQTNPDRLKLAIASCMDDFVSKFVIWDTLAAKNPEYLLLIGDNVYADKTGLDQVTKIDPVKLWNRYVDVRLSLPIYFQEKLIPVHALWDDHDYGTKDGGEDFEYKKESKEIFDTFFAQNLSDDDYLLGLGVGGMLTLGDFNLYFLDGRSFRSRKQDGRHLGKEQTAWLLEKLKQENTPSLLIKGDQFFGGYHNFDSYEGNHPEDFKSFIKELTTLNTPFVFISGDRHMSEIMQFPRGLFTRPSFEITSSPIHGKTYPDSTDSNPWRVIANKKDINFTIMNNVAKDNHWFMEVENIGENGQIYYQRELAVFIKDLQNNLNEVRKFRKGQRRYKRIKARGRRRRR